MGVMKGRNGARSGGNGGHWVSMLHIRTSILALGLVLAACVLVAGHLHFSLSLILMHTIPSHLQWSHTPHLSHYFPLDQDLNSMGIVEEGDGIVSRHAVDAFLRKRPPAEFEEMAYSNAANKAAIQNLNGGARHEVRLRGLQIGSSLQRSGEPQDRESVDFLEEMRSLVKEQHESSQDDLPDTASAFGMPIRRKRKRVRIQEARKGKDSAGSVRRLDLENSGKDEPQERLAVAREDEPGHLDVRGWDKRMLAVLSASAKGDGSCPVSSGSARAKCGPHGVCSKQTCRCVQAYSGPLCDTPRPFGLAMHAEFEGHFVLSQRQVAARGGVFAISNPKAGDALDGSGGPRNVSARLSQAPADDARLLAALREGHLSSMPETVTPSLVAMMPEDDVLAGVLFDTCAVVGNSGLSLSYLQGHEIDSHSAIFRFNSAPLEGVVNGQRVDYRPHVGERTTFRLVNSAHTGAATGDEIRLQQLQSKSGLFKYLQYVYNHPESNLVAFDTDFTAYVSSNLPLLPTGGFFAVLLALQKCMLVDVYGFYWQPGQSIPHHYFNAEAPLTGRDTVHDYELEFGKLTALAQEGLVRFRQPCVAGCEAETGIPCATCAPGSTCACLTGLPAPVALPGFCHLPGNYSCFYKCATCQGGPHQSHCPFDFDPISLDASCATEDEVSSMASHKLPRWAKPSGLRDDGGLIYHGGASEEGEAFDKEAGSSLQELEALFD